MVMNSPERSFEKVANSPERSLETGFEVAAGSARIIIYSKMIFMDIQ